jgi:hypothetical protein
MFRGFSAGLRLRAGIMKLIDIRADERSITKSRGARNPATLHLHTTPNTYLEQRQWKAHRSRSHIKTHCEVSAAELPGIGRHHERKS